MPVFEFAYDVPAVQGQDAVSPSNALQSVGPNQRNLYPARFILPNIGLGVEFSRALGSNLSSAGIIALLGRDVLSKMILIYSGISARLTIAY